MNTNENKLDNRAWAAVCHGAALLGLIIPFGNLIGPFLIWILKKDDLLEVMSEGKEAINFQLTATLCMVPLWLVSMKLIEIPETFMAIYWMRYLVSLVAMSFSGIMAYKIYQQAPFKYPLNLKFIK